ncbi:MAG TPA: hypothetical protein VM266_03520 [Solirubrobacteraceae bacterium]|nr:hypothetical protein [Solirubrobacteraceae bacterium]
MHRLPRRTLGALTAVLFAGSAAVALAAPDRSTELTTANPTFEWDGGPLTGLILGVDDDRDDTLVKLPGGGNLAIKLTDFEDDGGEPDFDIRLYVADAEGDPQGEPLGEAITADTEQESLSVKGLSPGSYVIEVNAFLTFNGTFHGKVTASGGSGAGGDGGTADPTPPGGEPTPAPGTPPTGGSDETPDAKIGKIARKPKSFSGTASDDKGVSKVEVAVQLKKGKKCRQMTRKGTFVKLAKCDAPTSWLAAKGTTKWSYKLRKKLKKGSYTLFARATDSAGQQQAGFTSDNKKAFKVR